MKHLFFLLLIPAILFGQSPADNMITIKKASTLKKEPNIFSAAVATLKKDTTVIPTDLKNGFWEFSYNNEKTYVNDNNIEDNNSKEYWKNIFQSSVDEINKEKTLRHENSLKAINSSKNKYLKPTENVEKFFEKFFDVKVEKGQFESSADYADRIKVDTSKIYYFEVGRITSNAEYDTDKQHFSIYVSRDLLLKRKEENLGTYVGQNAFNVKKEITKTSIKEYYFDLVGEVKNIEGEPLYKYCIIPCPISKAKALSINMSARIGISLIGYRNSDVDVSHAKPTITAPEEILKSKYKIICNIKSLVIYDEKSANILELYQK